MQPADVFGIVVRTIGLIIVLHGLWYAAYAVGRSVSVSRLLVICSSVLWMLSLAMPAEAVTVLSETFANDSAFAKSNASGPSRFFRDIEDNNEYWGINDPVGSGDDYDGDPVPFSSDIPPY